MKKSLRQLFSLLLVLSLLVSLSISALAETVEDNPEGTTVAEVVKGDVMEENNGTVEINNGSINNNYGDVTTSNEYIKENQEGGSVGTNNGSVIHNHSDVTTNGETGKIEDNGGTVSTNQGFVGNNNKTITQNDGYVLLNYGTIVSNTSDGYKNEETEENCGVKENYGTISSNSGTVYNNSSNMKVATYNKETDIWEYSNKMNEDGSAVPALIQNNTGTVETNTGTVENAEGGVVIGNWNGGTVNNGNGGTVEINDFYGTVYNEAGGTVENNTFDGTVYNEAGGVVKYNVGTVENEAGGEVKINAGTVENEAGGLLNDSLITYETIVDEDGNEYTVFSRELVQFVGEAGTYMQYTIKIGMDDTTEDGADEKTYEDIETDGVSEVWKQAAQNAAMDLKAVGKLFNREGYEVVGYVENNIADSWAASEEVPEEDPTVVYETSYTVTNYNSFLKLVWGKVKGVIVPPPVVEVVPETEEYTIPNYVIAKYVREGTVIQRGTHLFKVIMVEDGTILVATMGRLTQADLDDMMGFLAKYFSEAQLERLIGEPELLSEELTEEHFGDELEHICFRATADLFEG